MLKKVLTVILNFLKGIVRFLFFILTILFARIILFLGGERDKEGEITVRKARRIRFFTKIKLFMGRHLWVADLFGIKPYIIDFNERLGYGV